MALVWIVCGSHRGVGKTRVSQALASVLPGAAAAKLGCSRNQIDKPGNYFRDPKTLRAFIGKSQDRPHLILEANRFDIRRLGDIVIFLDGRPGDRKPRADAAKLRAAAHIRITPDAFEKRRSGDRRSDPRAWPGILASWIEDPGLRRAVCRIFEDQARHLAEPRVSVRTKTWFVHNGMRVFGLGVYRLMSEIDRCGSLKEAAMRSGISYRYAWGLLKAAESAWGRRLVDRDPSGSCLTEDGQRILRVFDKVNRDVERFADQCFKAHGAAVKLP